MNYDHLVSLLREGVAEHGAAAAVLQTRVAELTQQRAECERQFQEQQRRAERAEAELAAARAMLRELKMQFMDGSDTNARIDAALAGERREGEG